MNKIVEISQDEKKSILEKYKRAARNGCPLYFSNMAKTNIMEVICLLRCAL